MRPKRFFLLLAFFAIVAIGFYGVHLIRRGFSTADDPSFAEKTIARAARELSIPRIARQEQNPWTASPDGTSIQVAFAGLAEDVYRSPDGSGQTTVGRIRNGVRLTGMPGWARPHDEQSDDSWKLVLFIRSLREPATQELTQQSATANSAHLSGSASCEKCHKQIYERWKRTPMAHVIRDPRQFPAVIIPDLATNTISKFTKDQVAFVYGNLWKQRYFTKIGDDFFPQSPQGDVTHRVWRPYFVAKGTDWWEPFYPPDNIQRPTGPLCDGCHSVDYNIKTKQVAEWNVGCEKCYGPASDHVAHPTRQNILNPAHMNYERFVHPVPLTRTPAHQSHRRKILRLAGWFPRRSEPARVLATRKSTRWAKPRSLTFLTARPTKTACREMILCKS
jgi:Cytochrome c554 and c-prime